MKSYYNRYKILSYKEPYSITYVGLERKNMVLFMVGGLSNFLLRW